MNAAAPRPLGETLNQRQKHLLLVSLMCAMFMGALDQTIVATAAPRIVASLNGFSLLSWVFTTYMLTSTVLVPMVGKLSDIYGRKPLLMSGILIFLISSAGCGASPTMAALIVCRGVQGIGGGIIFATVFAVVGDIFPPAERGKYMGLFTGTFALASVLGPAAGGLLTDNVGWRWIFYINVPVGIVALPAIWSNLPYTRGGRKPRIDYLGGALLAVAATAGLLVLSWAGEQYGWVGGVSLLLYALALIGTVAFVWQELRHPEPIIPFHLFREREFLLGNLIVLTLGLAMQGSVPYLPTFLQVAQNATSTASGLLTTPQSAGVLLTSIVGGQILSRTGKYKLITISGIVMMLVSFALMLRLAPGTPGWYFAALLVLLGLGGGLTMPTMSVVIQNAVSHAYLGVATSSRQFFMQIGGVAGTALFGVLLTTTFQAQYRHDVPQPTRAAISADTLRKFEDPTVSFDPVAYGALQQEFLSQPDGETHFAAARQAQRTAISSAIHRIFIVSLSVMGGTLLIALLLQERPLRRTLGPDEAADEQGGALVTAALPVH